MEENPYKAPAEQPKRPILNVRREVLAFIVASLATLALIIICSLMED